VDTANLAMARWHLPDFRETRVLVVRRPNY
jgi:hypothetical protein